MADEIKEQLAKEVISPNESLLAHEQEIYPELISPKENVAVNEDDNVKLKAESKPARSKAMKTLTGTFVTAGAAATFGVTTLINTDMSAEFKQAAYQDGHIAYQIDVSDMTDKQTLYLHFYDGKDELEVFDLTEKALNAENGVITGDIEFTTDMINDVNSRITDKNTDVTFNLTLTGNVGLSVERTFDNYAVQFYHAESKFEKVTGECHCGVDGYYYFNIIYTDDYGIFKDFKAYIEDAEGNKSECSDLNDSNAHDQHRIWVVDLKSSACKLVVSYSVEGDSEAKVVETNINL